MSIFDSYQMKNENQSIIQIIQRNIFKIPNKINSNKSSSSLKQLKSNQGIFSNLNLSDDNTDKIITNINNPNFSIHSLINLIYNNEFNNETKTEAEDNVFSFLINLLFERFFHDSLFYLPQLVSILVYKDSVPLELFLIEKIKDKFTYALRIFWLIMSFSSIDGCSNRNNDLIIKSNKIEMAFVNSTNINKEYGNKSEEPDIIIYKRSVTKEMKLNYFNDLYKFYDKINQICENMMKIPRESRKDYLNKSIIDINNDINQSKLKIDKYEHAFDLNKLYFYGILLPIETQAQEKDIIILRIIPSLSSFFNSKARVPILLRFETVELDEIKNWKKLISDDDFLYVKNEFVLNFNDDEVYKKENNTKRTSVIIEYNSIDDFINKVSYIDMNNLNKNSEENKDDYYNEGINKETRNTISNFSHSDNDNVKSNIDKYSCLLQWKKLSPSENPFGMPWELQEKEYKSNSLFYKFKSYKIKSYIFKTNDDLKQELLCMQLIKRIGEIFKKNGLPLKVFPYEIVITTDRCGFVELIPNTHSIDYLKKYFQSKSLKDIYNILFEQNFDDAQLNFMYSLAAYSIICYILQIKDRHNGNILIDNNGNLIHIDFGFILGASPGNMNFENVPFKLTKDYIDLLGGIDSELFAYFKIMIGKGLLALVEESENLKDIIDIMIKTGTDLPCFNLYGKEIINNIDIRLTVPSKGDFITYAENLVETSMNSWKTKNYDTFQYYTNGIYP